MLQRPDVAPTRRAGAEAWANIVIARAAQRAGACRPMPFVGVGLLEVKAPATDEVDRFAQGGRHGGEKLFISVKRHRHTPSP